MVEQSPHERFSPSEVAKASSPLRRLYAWVVGWADHPGGVWALLVLAFAESSVFPVPPDVLLLALAFGKPRRSFRFALVCTLGSVSGGMLGYVIGWGFWQVVGDFFLTYVISAGAFETVGNLYNKHTFLAVFTAGFTPIPYKVFTLAAGVFRIPFPGFLAASLLGRGGRFFLVGALIFFFGERVRAVVDRHFGLATILFTIALIGGFVLIRYAF